MNKLLNKTLLYFTLFSTILLLMTAPLFYWAIGHMYLDDIDEAIELRQEEFLKKNLPDLKINDIPLWNKFNRDSRIFPDTISEEKEEILQTLLFNPIEEEWDPYRVLYTDIQIENRPFIFMIRLNLIESEDLMETMSALYFLILFILLGVLFIITRFLSNSIWKPFYETLQKVEQFNIEQHAIPDFTITKIDEFKKLNQRLTKLIEQNLKAYKAQKEFTENASHELQTPLAVFQSKLDLLIQQPSLNEEQIKIILSLYDAAARLTRVNKNLLLLSKIENKRYHEKESVNISRIIHEVLPYFSEQAESKNIQIKVDLSEPFMVNTNKGLIEIMINNLILNAIRHNYENGTLFIKLHTDRLIISNSGSKEALHISNLFKRFSKTSENAYSSGLGLAIVFQICLLNGWEINYVFEDSFHTFSVVF